MQILSKLRGQVGGVRAAGLDLNDQGLCWVELRQDKERGLALERCLFEPLAPGCIVEGQILEFSEVEAALARLLSRPHASPSSDASPSSQGISPLALAVPASLVTTHLVSFPARVSDAVLAQRLQADMAARVRLKAEAICVDFLPRLADGLKKDERESRQSDLVAAVVAKNAVEDRVALVEGAGLPWRVDLMALVGQATVLAASRAVHAQARRPSAVMALVQFEADGLLLDVLQGTKVLHSERFVVAHSLAHSRAGEPQVEYPLELPDGLLEALDAPYGSATAGRPEQLWLVAPASPAAAWARVLQERTGLPCALVDPFEGMLRDNLDEGNRVDAAQALAACGLALMALSDLGAASQVALQPRFNFLPHRDALSVLRKKSFVLQLAAVTLTVLLGTAAMQLALSEQLNTHKGAQAEVQQAIAGLDAELARLAGAAAELERLQGHERVLTAFAQSRQQTPLKWQELSALLPNGLHLTSLRQDAQGAAILSGQARSAAEVFALIERLAGGSQHFKRPELLDLSSLDAAAAAAAPHARQPGAPAAALAATAAAPPADPAAFTASAAAPIHTLAAATQAGLVERVVFSLRAESP